MELSGTSKTKFTLALAEKIYFLSAKGLTEAEVCDVVGISYATLKRWKNSKTFKEKLEQSKRDIDDRVEQSLLKRALGTKVVEKKQERIKTGTDQAGNPVYEEKQVITETEIPPDTKACILWLQNRRKDEWRSGGEVNIDARQQSVLISNSTDAAEALKELYGNELTKTARRIAETLGIGLEVSPSESDA